MHFSFHNSLLHFLLAIKLLLPLQPLKKVDKVEITSIISPLPDHRTPSKDFKVTSSSFLKASRLR